MFSNWNIEDNSKHGFKAKDTSGILQQIGKIESWIDPKVSPEVREEFQALLSFAKEIWSARFNWARNRGLGQWPNVYLYQVEMMSEEIRFFAGFQTGADTVLMDQDGSEFLPITRHWERDCGTRNTYNTSDASGIAEILKVRSYTRLGR